MIDQMQFGKRIIDLYKFTFDNTYDFMTTMQDQNEKTVSMFFDQTTWKPEQEKQPIGDWFQAAKKGREYFKKTVDDNFIKMEGVFVATEKEKPAAENKKQK